MRNFLLLSVTCILTISLYAQPTFGIKGGINIATLRSGNSGNSGSKLSYHAGIFSNLQFNPKWSIQPEVIYSKQGIRQSISGSNYDINLDYINIPVLVQLLIKPGLRLEAGPQFGFLLSAKNIYLGVQKDIQNNYKSFDFSFPIGISYLWRSGFGINARWVPGFSELNVTYGSSKNSVSQLGLFYQLKKPNIK